ncbi:NADP-dependent isocitrate dehydrogenase [Candidatus Hoaglandella endobia]|uniref:Isocitrate dehydrogenase [NADP] n=1 Tax=Candidatus Hoaglandella endobia TaxID=1778263 RepID=A0A143WUP9_9ENTR|nr:NADP-dependent isocitrate dehydrogenase [Candidatus Hoaglandella endobia]CUX97346.1 Isocitrate dehydrogenase [NADP] [Candidatus Hoaglandella endobia]
MSQKYKIIYTLTDEAPALASYSLLPIIHAFTQFLGISVETRDISLASRILANFPEYLQPAQRLSDNLAELGKLALTPQANIIKLPNISASLPQLKAAIKELQEQGYGVPYYADEPKTDAETEAKMRYEKIKGSAVNPVLREGNSDRRAPLAVKNYARNHPHRMGAWSSSSLSHVAHMQSGDFYGNEKSVLIEHEGNISIILVGNNRYRQVLKNKITVSAGDIIDAAVMSKKALSSFIVQQIEDAKQQGVLLSLHLKATMMKVSDPIIFGIVVFEFYKEILAQFSSKLEMLGFNVTYGIGDLYEKIKDLPLGEQEEITQAIDQLYADRPKLAMVNPNEGITNLHVPSDIIVDASMPAMIRDSGKMLGPDGQLHDTKAIIPDRCYAGVYQAVIENCKQHGAFDPTIIGSVPNIGLMAQQAEEYGSHDKTFQILADDVVVQVTDEVGKVLLEHPVEAGDIWRMCQSKDAPIQAWVKLAVNRVRESHTPAVFWLDASRTHDVCMIEKVQRYLQDYDTSRLDIRILSPVDAVQFSIERVRAGQDTISVTGNVLRDYLTDLFPIIELGTSAKMLSIVPLMAGGGLFETGAGGTAPKHVQQFIQENHLRWDSLGEFLALTASLEQFCIVTSNSQAKILAKMLHKATVKFMETNKFPSRQVGELDNRGSHFYMALFWAQALAEQNDDQLLKQQFNVLAHTLTENEQKIVAELNRVQGTKVDIGGYYHPDPILTSQAMRPSATLNAALLTVSDTKLL